MSSPRSEAYSRSFRTCREIARKLIEGPDGIGAPSRGRGGYFDPVLAVEWYPSLQSQADVSSACVYVDNTNGRDERFLAPLVRFANWQRAYEARVRRVRRWPRVEVRQHLLDEEECFELDRLMRRLDERLGRPGFVTGGLIRDRMPPEGCETETPFPGGFKVKRWNFCQRIELSLGLELAATKDVEVAAGDILRYVAAVSMVDRVRYEKWFHGPGRHSLDGFKYRPTLPKAV